MFATEKLARAETKLDACSFLLLHPGQEEQQEEEQQQQQHLWISSFPFKSLGFLSSNKKHPPRLLVSGQRCILATPGLSLVVFSRSIE